MSENKNDGGPAYPASKIVSLSYSEQFGAFPIYENTPGMSLRDYFAGQALNGILSNSETELLKQKLEEENPKAIDVWDSAISESAYDIADAMLKERDK